MLYNLASRKLTHGADFRVMPLLAVLCLPMLACLLFFLFPWHGVTGSGPFCLIGWTIVSFCSTHQDFFNQDPPKMYAFFATNNDEQRRTTTNNDEQRRTKKIPPCDEPVSNPVKDHNPVHHMTVPSFAPDNIYQWLVGLSVEARTKLNHN